MKTLHYLAFVIVALFVFAACGDAERSEDPNLGSDALAAGEDFEPEPGTPYDPCEGLSCGDQCFICAPDDLDCAEPRAVHSCTEEGRCVLEAQVCKEDPAPPYDPCEGLSCGENCSQCPPDDDDCYEPAVVNYCQADGSCSPHQPLCESDDIEPYDPCGDLRCGDYCSHCPPWDPSCVEPAVVNYCQADGSCSPQRPVCEDPAPPYDPCEGLSCGDNCSQCPPDDDDCYEPAVVNYCQADGSCSPLQPVCEGEPEPYDPCEGLTCGDYCSHCPPWDPSCVEPAVINYCQADGSCHPLQPICLSDDAGTEPYDPCEGLVCGEQCTLCPPNDPDCFETTELKFCTDDGQCVGAAFPTCSM